MIHQPLKNKKGGTKGAVEYLLNERERAGTARVLKGDAELTKEIIKSLEHRKQRATVGVLSFEEKNIPEDVKLKIMDEFEKTLLPGMEHRYNILWVEHTDKGRLELNYVIPKIDLLTQKSLNPYYDRADRARIEIFRDKINLEHNLSSPNDPAKQQTLNNDKRINLLKDYKELDIVLHDLVASKAIQSREQLIKTVKDNGMQVTRTAKNSISIKLPESKAAKKFKGGIYNEQFTSIRELEASSERTREAIQHYASRAAHLEIHRLEQKLESYTQRKSEDLKREFAHAEQKFTRRIAERNLERAEMEQIANFNSHRSVNINNISTEHSSSDELNHLESTEKIPRNGNGREQIYQNSDITVNEFAGERHSQIFESRGEINDITRDNITRRASQREATQQEVADKLRAELKSNHERIQRELKLNTEQLRAELNTDDAELYKQAKIAMQRIREHRTITKRLRETIRSFGEKLQSFKQSINELFEQRRFLERAMEQGDTKEEAKYLSEYVKDAHKIIKNQDDLNFAYEMRGRFHIKVDKESLKEYKELAIRLYEESEKEGFDYDVVLKSVIKHKYYSHEQSRDQGLSM